MKGNEPPKEEHGDLHARVAAHPFLAGMTPSHIELLAKTASPAQFGRDEVIFRVGEEAHGFFLIERGSVSVEGAMADKPHVQVELVSGGQPLGWSWLFPPYQWHYDARATEPTHALFFDRNRLREVCDDDLTLGNEIFQRISAVMAHRLQAAHTRLVEALHPAMSEPSR